jgi:hypothetical protein
LTVGQLGIVVCLTLVAARPALAQRASPRQPSSGGLYGATRSDVGGAQKLTFEVQVAEGLDSDLDPALASRISRSIQTGGYSTLFEASSDYAHTSKRLRLAGNVSTAFRYYQSLDRLDALSHTVGLGANVTLPKSGRLQVDQSAAYSPAYLYQLFPVDDSLVLGESIPANPDYQIVDNESYSYNTRLALSFGSARGTMVTTSGTFTRTDTEQQVATYGDLDTYEAGVEVAHHVPRGGFSVAYDRRRGEFATGSISKEHRVTFGAEYSPALSRTRRLSFRFELTPTQFDGTQITPDPTIDGPVNTNRWLVSGEASVAYPFRPNWRTTARYRRDTQYLSVLGQPVVADATRLELAGLMARRVDLSVLAGYATAASVVNESAQTLQTYTGQVVIRYALKRSIALYSEYLYYYYDQRGPEQLAPGLSAVFEQHGIRVGVALFIEALGR